MSPLFSLTGRVALVTGGTRGLGRAIAEAYAHAGARVVISSEDDAACARAQAELQARGLAITAHAADVRDDAAQAALVQATVQAHGGLDVVVANAGIGDPMQGSLAPGPEAYRRVMDINLDSIVRLCALAVPHLKARGGGSLILMSSLSAVRGNKALGPYALAKAALSQLARNLAVELGPDNIRTNAIAPGFIATELSSPLLTDAAFMARRLQMTPLRRPGSPEEVAGPALLLASPGGAFINGQTLVVDGGTLITDGS
ncbi:NAD(P)-dependent dehydrogenase (short-subunit alcohol dehydrogenase family) [Sphaerotilus hippei]|uniref:NAD(P)-dependent dehydrogenase (Short-subunit alcohol dehydrogenase family) n=1 Tax=Sphaerotilus hippei TaxID=744406 RepID=A0A318H2R0_9BURK|nr:SDR family oxidoreductase [Sphaerotilus hippei]PXW97533.1 NAD(P)-dependent dehydrogenase (short-subunit alcohol dehydrogenase family) [Sphaerotilus hippei]